MTFNQTNNNAGDVINAAVCERAGELAAIGVHLILFSAQFTGERYEREQLCVIIDRLRQLAKDC